MKKIIYTLSIVFTTVTFAQNNPVDKMETTKTKTEMVEEDGKMVEKKIMVKTTKEQEVMTDPAQAEMRDADRVLPPTKVSKKIMVDTDNDPFYDNNTEIVYYTYKNEKYSFKSDGKGFVMSRPNGDNEMIIGKARKSSKNDYYIITAKDYNGIGYFDNDKNFIVEYYDEKRDEIMTFTFGENKF